MSADSLFLFEKYCQSFGFTENETARLRLMTGDINKVSFDLCRIYDYFKQNFYFVGQDNKVTKVVREKSRRWSGSGMRELSIFDRIMNGDAKAVADALESDGPFVERPQKFVNRVRETLGL